MKSHSICNKFYPFCEKKLSLRILRNRIENIDNYFVNICGKSLSSKPSKSLFYHTFEGHNINECIDITNKIIKKIQLCYNRFKKTCELLNIEEENLKIELELFRMRKEEYDLKKYLKYVNDISTKKIEDDSFKVLCNEAWNKGVSIRRYEENKNVFIDIYRE